MLDVNKVEYVNSGAMWFIKYRKNFTGGRYDSRETAVYAVEMLSEPDMEILWMDKVVRNPELDGVDLFLSRKDIDAFLENELGSDG
ncbi:hypothetical protein HV042_16185 [Klebsiella grimontii]|uniref:hypothetical protein n=1 Tax=Klebsiella grimontii TaxID=2058152 RepID=UPI0015E5412A|nr:hypothetical protein [Klebsiella grimontii]MDG9896427.1 hypothetical protein [Klebsiella grimontii]QLP08383.1 hypothetical protein HV042_15535 [Klebsiella grimontii]QLP08501.1 hypothetical protein HV042_16185 [Klebsiella grimontii]